METKDVYVDDHPGPTRLPESNLRSLPAAAFHGGFRLAGPLWDFDIRFGAPRLWGLRSRIAGSDRSRRAVHESRAHQKKSSKQPRKPRTGFFFARTGFFCTGFSLNCLKKPESVTRKGRFGCLWPYCRALRDCLPNGGMEGYLWP